jgi:dihydroorotate dehydrogenase (fumarate)
LLSTPQALRLPLTWIGILFGRLKTSLAGTGGVHDAKDVMKLIMVGADVTEMCSTLLRNGIEHIRTIEQGVRDWMDEYEYESVQQMKGSMSQMRCADPAAFERTHYMRAVRSMDFVQMTGREAWRLLATD